ncbi:zinc ribbon domain-containing protein [Streptomyces sp. NPDC015139]|uniref:zinc ribbon domain-containing protein n=1 Tax=Streptomyces sp. NPDC015139 TaxID=3364942 RepID=UPI0036FFB2D3
MGLWRRCDGPRGTDDAFKSLVGDGWCSPDGVALPASAAGENRPTQEKFHCQACGHNAHADTVGAINVLRAGLVRRDANPA